VRNIFVIGVSMAALNTFTLLVATLQISGDTNRTHCWRLHGKSGYAKATDVYAILILFLVWFVQASSERSRIKQAIIFLCLQSVCTVITWIQLCQMEIYFLFSSGIPRGGGWLGGSTPPKFRKPSKIVPNSTRLCKLLKIAEFRTPTPEDIRKKGSKFLKLTRVAIVLH